MAGAITIRVEQVRHWFGQTLVLDGISTHACEGAIYALLGPSGCGKTTLFSHIVGDLAPKEGKISVLGRSPGEDPYSIGYMPQEVALVTELTVYEMLKYFGLIAGMAEDKIKFRAEHLRVVLELPDLDTIIGELSGGQQRRVSFAISLIHDPKILILDEPTVGQDPILRKQIWDYIQMLAKDEKKTILMATHYIEEARDANVIALMRKGRLLQVGPPEDLLNKYKCQSLEELFILMCGKGDVGAMQEERKLLPEVKLSSLPLRRRKFMAHGKALLLKNYMKILRSRGTCAFIILLPIMQIMLFLFSMSNTIPRNIRLGVVNHELRDYDCLKLNTTIRSIDEDRCELKGLSCLYLQMLPKELQYHVYFASATEAQEAVKKAEILLFFEFHKHFSDKLQLYRDNFVGVRPKDFDELSIHIVEDKTDLTTITLVERVLIDTYRRFTKRVDEECGFETPTHFSPLGEFIPVNAPVTRNLQTYYTPRFIIALGCSLAVNMSILTIILERMDGVWKRTTVAGVSKLEILIWQVFTMATVATLQSVIVFTCVFQLYGIDCKGDKLTALLLMIAQSLLSSFLGVAISAFANDVRFCVGISQNCLLGCFCICGIIWPIQGMPTILQFISTYITPVTIPIDAFTNVVIKGWDISQFGVAKGIYFPIVWSLMIFSACVIKLKYEK